MKRIKINVPAKKERIRRAFTAGAKANGMTQLQYIENLLLCEAALKKLTPKKYIEVRQDKNTATECVFCNILTTWWTEEANIPVCLKCSLSHDDDEAHKLFWGEL